MGNAPSESNMGDRLRCYRCDTVLPPCKSFSDLTNFTYEGREMYIYNQGQYYRLKGHHSQYKCARCFHKEKRDKVRKQEEMRRKARQRAAEKAVDEKLRESEQQAKEQREAREEELIQAEQSRRRVHISHLEEVREGPDTDQLLETLSLKCSIPVSELSLDQLSAEQLQSVAGALEQFLFRDWLDEPPSLGTMQHTQVLLTELCVMSLQIPDGLSLQTMSYHVQSLVETVGQSARSVSEALLLTQGLYLNLVQLLSGRCDDSDAVLMAKLWAEGELSADDLHLVGFLGSLMSSLQRAVERACVVVLDAEVQCLKLLLSTFTHVSGRESHREPTEKLVQLVESNRWTCTEAVALLKALAQTYQDDAQITEVVTMMQVYNISPEWTDDCGRSLIQALQSLRSERFLPEFLKTLRKQDENSLDSVLEELKRVKNLDDSVAQIMKNITTGVLRYSENAPKDEPFQKHSFKGANMDENDIQNAANQLCQAVSNTKQWWPTAQQTLAWCSWFLPARNGPVQQVGTDEDPCVAAMLVASQVCMGNKVDVVLSPDENSHQKIEDWSDFYQHLGISIEANTRNANASQRDVYRADVVYGTIDDFVSDYLLLGLEAMEAGDSPTSRGFMVEEGSLSAFNRLDLSSFKENDALTCTAEILQNLMGSFQREDVELRHRFMKALLRALHAQVNTHTDSSFITILRTCTGKELSTSEIYVLMLLENLLTEFSGKAEGRLCLEGLFGCAEKFQSSTEQTKDLFQMMSNIVREELWTPAEVLNLLAALASHHHEGDSVSIMKILHLIQTYQVSPQWTDEKNQSLLMLLASCETQNLIQHLQQSLRDEEKKSIDCLFDEIRQMENVDEQTLQKSYDVVTTVMKLVESGEIRNHTDVAVARTCSRSMNTEDLQRVLAVLCNAVHLHRAEEKWFPRATQMISWCLLALSDHGKLLEMGTGEGKSCVIAMFAALQVLRGEKVDVVSSSSVLCQRDAMEWEDFYSYFDITVDTNTNKTKDEERKECYQSDIVYGTIEAFAADHLRQTFEMKDVRPDRGYHCIIIDEVDSLLLDQGVQLTYLSSPMVAMQHLNTLLAMIWGHVCQYSFLSTGHQSFLQGPPASFFKATFDSIQSEEINDPMDVLHIAEDAEIVPEGFTDDFFESTISEPLSTVTKLKTVSQDSMVRFFHEIENYVPYGFTVYTLDEDGSVCLTKSSPYANQEAPELTFLVLGEGLCCPLYESEDDLVEPIADFLSGKIQYTPCANDDKKISIPGFLKTLIDKKMSVWVENAFLARTLQQGQEYVIENDNICPVDFKSTGIVQRNKKWGDGLQQFLELKHQVNLSTISIVTNYVSNLSFFGKYDGKIYGTTGTLGSEADMLFLQDMYPTLSACNMPTFNRKKLFEVHGLLKMSVEEWKSEIKDAVMAEISPNSYREGRAALVICETINTAKQLHEELKTIVPGQTILYCRSDKDSLSRIDERLNPGDVIVATNLAGRGTNIKVSDQVNDSGGLFVVLSFLSDNSRVERQAFGRTARKGKPGSAQVIMTSGEMHDVFRTVSTLEEAKATRDRLAADRIDDMTDNITEMKLREDLFSEYCDTLQELYRHVQDDDDKVDVDIMNEYWGIWLQTNSEEIVQLKDSYLKENLRSNLEEARRLVEQQKSPSSSIYHYIKFGNIEMGKKSWSKAMNLFARAMDQDGSWAAIAYYSHAYCTIKNREENYLDGAIDDLKEAQKSLKYLSEECIISLQFSKMFTVDSAATTEPNGLEKQLTTKSNMFSYFERNICEALEKLEDIKARDRDAVAKRAAIITLVSSGDDDLQAQADDLYCRGLQYVFSVEEEPRFPWGALAVFCLGVLQVVAGALITAFTCGALAQVGIGLIVEGVSDCFYGAEAMIKGEFSWKAWAIDKAVSIAVSLIGFGAGKLVAKGYKATKVLVKGLNRKLKALPKFTATETKSIISKSTTQSLKNGFKESGKRLGEEFVFKGLERAEQAILDEILKALKEQVKKSITDNVKAQLEADRFVTSVNSIVLAHINDDQNISDVLGEKGKERLLAIFTELSKTSLEPFYTDLSWQKKLNKAFLGVMNQVKGGATGHSRTYQILVAIQTVHLSALAADAVHAVVTLSDQFYENFYDELSEFKEEMPRQKEVDELSDEEHGSLAEFRQELASSLSGLVADALVEVFHQKFSTHLVSMVQAKANGVIRRHVTTLKSAVHTQRKLAVVPNQKQSLAVKSGKRSESHAEKVKESKIAGTEVDLKVLSVTTNTKIVIMRQNDSGKLSKMQVLNSDAKAANQTVTLVFRPQGCENPDDQYDVLIDDEIVRGQSVFHAVARGMKPGASDADVALEALRLRTAEADALRKNPGRWESLIRHKLWTSTLRGGGPRNVIKENRSMFEREVNGETFSRKWIAQRRNGDPEEFIQTGQQPPLNVLVVAKKMNQRSRLAVAMLEKTTEHQGTRRFSELPIAYAPGNKMFSSSQMKSFRRLLASRICQDDAVATIKLTVIGAMPRIKFQWQMTMKVSATRFKSFEECFYQSAREMLKDWERILIPMGLMREEHHQNVDLWLNNRGYDDQKDPHRMQVLSLQ